MWVRVQHFLELIRFSHTIFALPFAMLSAVIAWAQADSIFRWRDLVGIVICMVTARSAAMAFNRQRESSHGQASYSCRVAVCPRGDAVYARDESRFHCDHNDFSAEAAAAVFVCPGAVVPAGLLVGQTLDKLLSLLAFSGPDDVSDRRVDCRAR